MPAAKSRSAATVHGVALADAAQVEPHARIEEADGLRAGVQLDQVAADVPAGLGQLLGAGGTAPARRAKPQASQSGPAVMS